MILRLHGIGLANHGVNRANQRRAVEVYHVVDECFAVLHRLALILRGATEIASRTHAGADRAADQASAIQRLFDLQRINVLGCLNGQFDSIESPLLELGK